MKRVQNRRIAGADGVKYVSSDEHQVGLQLDHPVDYTSQRDCDIRLPLVDPRRRLSLILPETEMYVGEVNESHRVRTARIHCVIFVRTCIGAPCGAPFRAGFAAIVDRTMMLLFESVIQPNLRSI